MGWIFWQNSTRPFFLTFCSEIKNENQNMFILTSTNLSGIFGCDWNEGQGWNFHLKYLDVNKMRDSYGLLSIGLNLQCIAFMELKWLDLIMFKAFGWSNLPWKKGLMAGENPSYNPLWAKKMVGYFTFPLCPVWIKELVGYRCNIMLVNGTDWV